MSIPASYLETLRERVSIAETITRRIGFDAAKSAPAKGDYWACCPFHGEKTPSFHVRDRDGYFYCFGCHEKGSAIDFLMKFERLSFPEAVEVLAAEAGMPPPVRDARAAKREAKRATLGEATEAAVRFFREQLDSAAGAEARAYLQGRGLTRETIDRFEIGFAPDRRDGALRALTGAGLDRDLLIGADICAKSDRDGAVYDRFRNRIIFPIRDGSGRTCLAFGGRALDPGAKAKYLNSRETELFQKSRVLYNFARARAASGAGRPLLVVEGYMDVVALGQAGIETAVAPLGTALTEQQLDLLWRAADEPILALDGDVAGQRAAGRAADLALPKLRPGKSVCFVTLPEGRDPDDVVRAGGAAAMERLIEEAAPLIDVVWRRLLAEHRLDTPERRAAFDKALQGVQGKIEDASVRGHFAQELKDRRFHLFRSQRSPMTQAPLGPQGPGGARRASAAGPMGRSAWRGGGSVFAEGPTAEAKAAAIADASNSADPAVMREGAILVLLLERPALLDERMTVVEDLDFLDAALDSVKNALLCGVASLDDLPRDPDDANAVAARSSALEAFVDERCGRDVCRELRLRLKNRLGGPFSSLDAQLDQVRRLFDELVTQHRADLTWRREIDAYRTELLDDLSEDLEPRRLQEAAREQVRSRDAARETAVQAEQTTSGRLKALAASEPWVRRKRRGDAP
ncbi:MAG: DNA primase [Pseudomonadota bacterium]